MIWLLLQKMAIAGLAAVGFALLFNVPQQALRYCATLGALGYGLRSALIVSGVSGTVIANFCAAALISFIGVALGKRYRAHPKVFTVASIIPMIPGVYAYRAMTALLQIQKYGYSPHYFGAMVENLVQAGFLVAALVFGLALPGLLFYRHRPVI